MESRSSVRTAVDERDPGLSLECLVDAVALVHVDVDVSIKSAGAEGAPGAAFTVLIPTIARPPG
jgi:hypothetical protein